MIYWPAKAPGEVRIETIDFTSILPAGETITGTPTISAMGVTAGSPTVSGGTKVTFNLSGGALGTPGVVVVTVATNSADTFSRTAIVPIGEEPVTLPMAKAQLRYEDEAVEDDLIAELIQSAREHVEKYTGTVLFPTAVTMTFDSFDHLDKLTKGPIQSITQVQYLDVNGVLQTLSSSIYEFVNVNADVLRPRIRLALNQTWPSTRIAEDAVQVTAVVGYTVVPHPLIRAILLLVTLWFDERNPVAVDVRGTPTELPSTMDALLANFRL